MITEEVWPKKKKCSKEKNDKPCESNKKTVAEEGVLWENKYSSWWL